MDYEEKYIHTHLRFWNQLLIKKKKKKRIKYFIKILIKLLLIIFLSFLYLLLLIGFNLYQSPNRDDFSFIVCLFGKEKLTINDRIIKYFESIDRFLPKSKIVLAVSEFTIIEPQLIDFKNISITIERYGNITVQEIDKKYNFGGAPYYYYTGIRQTFYNYYLKNHPEIKYVAISDDDTLFIRDPFLLIVEDPNVVHIMEDIFPFSKTNDANYFWTNIWVNLNNSLKIECGINLLNYTLLSNEIKDIIPLNVGMTIGCSKNIIKFSELFSSKFECTGMFPYKQEQGFLNYLYISGQLNELDFQLHRHNIFNGSLISCPNLMPLENYSKQINSDHIIAVHHYQFMKSNYIENSPNFFQNIIKTK